MDVGDFGHRNDWNVGSPFMVVNAGETLSEAVERHRRQTGHAGELVVVAFNGRPRRSPWGSQGAARRSVAIAAATAA
jgi:hypothetical protein